MPGIRQRQIENVRARPNLSGFKRPGEPLAKVEYHPMDLLRFIGKNSMPLNTMMERAGMSEMGTFERTIPPMTATFQSAPPV